MPIPRKGPTSYKNGVTRNEKNKTWLARIMRNGVQETQYFSDRKYSSEEAAKEAAIKWIEQKNKELGPRDPGAAKEYAMTTKNKSGVANVSLKKYVAKNRKGQVYYNWWGKWKERRGGKSFSIMKFGDEYAFVMAYLAAYRKTDNEEKIIDIIENMSQEEYDEILGMKRQSPPQEWLDTLEFITSDEEE